VNVIYRIVDSIVSTRLLYQAQLIKENRIGYTIQRSGRL